MSQETLVYQIQGSGTKKPRQQFFYFVGQPRWHAVLVEGDAMAIALLSVKLGPFHSVSVGTLSPTSRLLRSIHVLTLYHARRSSHWVPEAPVSSSFSADSDLTVAFFGITFVHRSK